VCIILFYIKKPTLSQLQTTEGSIATIRQFPFSKSIQSDQHTVYYLITLLIPLKTNNKIIDYNSQDFNRMYVTPKIKTFI